MGFHPIFCQHQFINMAPSKMILLAALVASASAFAPSTTFSRSVTLNMSEGEEEKKLGSGGMADTRDPETVDNVDDPRKSISAAPSFEEYQKMKEAEGN